MKSTLVKELLDLGDAFEQHHPNEADHTTANFLAWASMQSSEKQTVSVELPARYTDDIPAIPTFIAEYLTKAWRYFRLYMKKACETTPLLNFDDFVCLIYLIGEAPMTKTHMIEMTVNEKTSGMLVINRLISQGFIAQTDNADDRRSRYISLTDAGRAMLESIQPSVNQAVALLVGDLSDDEQRQLAYFLKRLDNFHQPLFLHHREASLAELERLRS
jgi:DNA-binding MarR family transcriptional regulator